MKYLGIEFVDDDALTVHTEKADGQKVDYILESDNWRNRISIEKVIKRPTLSKKYIGTKINGVGIRYYNPDMNMYMLHHLDLKNESETAYTQKNIETLVLYFTDNVKGTWVDSDFEIDLSDTKMKRIEVKEIS